MSNSTGELTVVLGLELGAEVLLAVPPLPPLALPAGVRLVPGLLRLALVPGFFVFPTFVGVLRLSRLPAAVLARLAPLPGIFLPAQRVAGLPHVRVLVRVL